MAVLLVMMQLVSRQVEKENFAFTGFGAQHTGNVNESYEENIAIFFLEIALRIQLPFITARNEVGTR